MAGSSFLHKVLHYNGLIIDWGLSISNSSTSVENKKNSSAAYFRTPALWNEESLNGFVEYSDDS